MKIKLGRPRKIQGWRLRQVKLLKMLGYDIGKLALKYNVSNRTIYRYLKRKA